MIFLYTLHVFYPIVLSKILIISESSVYLNEKKELLSKGGGATFVHNLAVSLRKSGKKLYVFALKEFPEQVDFEIIDGVSYCRKFSSSRSSFRLFNYLKLAYFESKNYETIIVNQFLPHLLLPFLGNKKTYSILHDIYLMDFTFWFRQFGLFKGLIGIVVEGVGLLFDRIFAEKIIVVSESTKDKFLKIFKNASKKVFLLRNSIDFSKYYSSSKEDFLLFVGRFVAYKRPKDLVFVLKKIREKYPNISAKFLATRDFPKIRGDLIEYAKELKVSNYEIIKTVADKDLKRLFSHAKILVHPSVVEGQGIVILEALASGVPVCAYNLPAYKGMLQNGKNSELCEIKDVNELSNSVLKILDNYDFYSQNTRKGLEDFSIEKYDDNVVSLFE